MFAYSVAFQPMSSIPAKVNVRPFLFHLNINAPSYILMVSLYLLFSCVRIYNLSCRLLLIIFLNKLDYFLSFNLSSISLSFPSSFPQKSYSHRGKMALAFLEIRKNRHCTNILVHTHTGVYTHTHTHTHTHTPFQFDLTCG
jgi:hypothetical protein